MASIKPIKSIHIIFPTHPKVLHGVSEIITSNGKTIAIANLKLLSPKGIPTKVKQRIIPIVKYSKANFIPPKIHHRIVFSMFLVLIF